MYNKTVKRKLVLKNNVKKFLNRLLATALIFLAGMICVKKDITFKEKITKVIYEQNISFAKLKKTYEKYFGNIVPVEKIIAEEKPVFNEHLTYTKENTYKDGVVLTVNENYMVPTLESGVVVFIGEKEEYGSTVIIDQADGIEVFYANINAMNLKLYDYIEKGTLLGETKDNKLYLVFSKNGEYLNYKDYI